MLTFKAGLGSRVLSGDFCARLFYELEYLENSTLFMTNNNLFYFPEINNVKSDFISSPEVIYLSFFSLELLLVAI